MTNDTPAKPSQAKPSQAKPSQAKPANYTHSDDKSSLTHLQASDYLADKIAGLKAIFPEIFCENSIDFAKLKAILGENNLAPANERYCLDWAGKSAAYRVLQSPTYNTLIPCREESVDFDSTQNLFIEAENLEALKILQKAYAGCVKMIYIDPPYNTGNDSFIYPDKFSETHEEYARRVGDTDDNGYLKRDGVFQGAFRKNAKDNGHYHSNWLNMMLPRLHLAKTLLSDDGVIFISIDDNEQAQLKLLCDEVFGEENCVSEIVWKRKRGRDNSATHISKSHEYCFLYAKNKNEFQVNYLELDDETKKAYKNPDNDSRGIYRILGCWARGTQGGVLYDFTDKNGNYFSERLWLFSKENLKKLDDDNKLIIKGDNVYRKMFLYENKGKIPESLWDDVSNAANASDEIKRLFENNIVFGSPKPIPYIKQMISLATTPNSLILDFFSGSGTTAHAVMQLNAEDGGNRRYICVQLPEETDEKSEAAKAGFATIAEIAKERIRRAGAKIKKENPDKTIDTGFKVFKLSESHFKQWQGNLKQDSSLNAQNDGVVTAHNDGLNSGSLKQSDWLENALQQHTDTLLSDNTENIFYELLFRFGLRPTAETIQDNGVFCVKDKGFVFVIQAENADEAFFENILQTYQPMKIVVVEKVFNGKDDFKKNTALQIKDAGVMFVCV